MRVLFSFSFFPFETGEVPVGLEGWSEQERVHVGEEMSDVLLYLIRMADKCGIDLAQAALG